MKKIILLLLIITEIMIVKSCMTDIYFGNDVWNPKEKKTEKNFS